MVVLAWSVVACLKKLNWLDVKLKLCGVEGAVDGDLVKSAREVPYVDVVDDVFKQMAGYCRKRSSLNVMATVVGVM